MIHQLDALTRNSFQYNPVGCGHAALAPDTLAHQPDGGVVQTACEWWSLTNFNSATEWPVEFRGGVQLRPTMYVRVARGVAIWYGRRAAPTAARVFPVIDAIFGHVRGVNGCHVYGVIPQLGRIPHALGAGVGAIVGLLVGWCVMPIFARENDTIGRCLQGSIHTGAVVGACVGGIPRWWLCQISGAVGLALKVGLIALQIVVLLLGDALECIVRSLHPKHTMGRSDVSSHTVAALPTNPEQPVVATLEVIPDGATINVAGRFRAATAVANLLRQVPGYGRVATWTEAQMETLQQTAVYHRIVSWTPWMRAHQRDLSVAAVALGWQVLLGKRVQ